MMNSICRLLFCLFLLSSFGSYASVTIEISKNHVPIDKQINIIISGLSPNTPYRVQLASDKLNSLGHWQLEALFDSDNFGAIDLAEDAPIQGSYAKTDSMGLFWSLEWLQKDNVGLVFPDYDSIYDLDIEVFSIGGTSLSTAAVKRSPCFKNRNIQKDEMDSAGVPAALFYPKGKKALPTVLVLSGSEGGRFSSESMACELAEKGFATIALAYFNYPGLPKHLIEIPLEYFMDSLVSLEHHPAIDLDKLAVTGGSKGGELSLLLASQFPVFKAVVAYVPSSVIWSGIDPTGQSPLASSWTLYGRSFDFMTFNYQGSEFITPPLNLRPGYSQPLSQVNQVEKSTIPVEQINGSIMVISGDDDQLWPSATFGDMITARLLAKNFPYEYLHLRYQDAGHGITRGFRPSTLHSSGLYLMGGTSSGNGKASIESWPKVIDFLKASLD